MIETVLSSGPQLSRIIPFLVLHDTETDSVFEMLHTSDLPQTAGSIQHNIYNAVQPSFNVS